jgi:hypothetical protein
MRTRSAEVGSNGAGVGLDDAMLSQLASERGLFHVDEREQGLARGLTLAPLTALQATLRPGMRTLETGCGGTTVVFAASGARHNVVTPDAEEVERVSTFCEERGIPLDHVNFIVGSSDRVLADWDQTLDLVLVDGAHRVPFPFLDWHYTAPWLKVGGHLFLDDLPIPSVALLYEFLCGEVDWELEEICGDKLAVFTKRAECPDDPTRDWELQRFNRPWVYSHVPVRRRWRTWRDRAMIGTRLRRLRDEWGSARGPR